MLKFINEVKNSEQTLTRHERYFPIFVAVFLSLLFCIYLVRYGVYPLFFTAH